MLDLQMQKSIHLATSDDESPRGNAGGGTIKFELKFGQNNLPQISSISTHKGDHAHGPSRTLPGEWATKYVCKSALLAGQFLT